MLKIEHLTKRYRGSDKGVFDINIHVEKGDIYAFIGHNGAGKTTTLKCVTGIHGFDEGVITIGGTDMEKEPLKCKRRLAYIPDNPDIYEYLTGIQYLNFTADVFEISARERSTLIERYADEFEITPYLGDLVSSYSHGMKQKLAIAAALLHEPELLVLDEPFVGLDPKAALTLKNIMRSMCERGGAIFFSTHVLDVAEKLCNKVAMIKDGRLTASGDMDKLLENGSTLEQVFMEALDDEKV